jgi:hypothetical protein
MKINGLIKKPRWYDITCCCGVEVMDKHPIKDCLHCKFEQCEKSMPRKDFKVNVDILDKDGKITGKTKAITIKEITITRGEKYQDIIGWSF